MSDALAVTGSRHGIFFEPHKRACALLRFAPFHSRAFFHLRAGLKVGSREIIFPLAPDQGAVDFNLVDQRTSPCTVRFIGLDSASGMKVRLTVTVPFKPRDTEFSTTPVLLFDLSVEPIGGQFRWDKVNAPPAKGELFFEITDGPFSFKESGKESLDLFFEAANHLPGTDSREQIAQQDRLIALQGQRSGRRFVQSVQLRRPDPRPLRVAWCTWSSPVLRVQGSKLPFLYTEKFASLDSVARWAKKEAFKIIENAVRVDAMLANHNLGPAASHLLAYTLHSWMLDTWWCRRPDGREWFSVWEGSCYFHSTVDVEFTQAPFYLAVWPELLAIELDYWPEYAKSGEACLGTRGAGTKYLSHDCGAFGEANAQVYPHDMEVEETANWVLMAFAHSRRTGDLSVVKKHARTLEQFLRFLIMADTTGNGVPDHGVANTIDDASPAIQFGKEQTYLAVKTLAAFETGAILLTELKDFKAAKVCRAQGKILRATISAKAWAGDHFTVLLKKGGRLKDPWNGNEVEWKTIPGWNAPHIYTANTLPILDMVGYDLKLDPARVKRDLEIATARCLREYGCAHTDFTPDEVKILQEARSLAGASRNPGWISMNMLRDLAALYRGIDLTAMFERYWEWQVTANTRETTLFFETFGGNNLNFYPRGVAFWGVFDAVNGIEIDVMRKIHRSHPRVPHLKAARLDLVKR
ncbi:MAG: glycoside hydrolase family 52 protein [Methylacidiphilales bacterium]|nr:glycoside hydrolase family 52 protein [Candidatus Methylacidiphilales bacterium]